MNDDDGPRWNRFEYDSASENFHAKYSPTEPSSLCTRLVTTVAAVSDREPHDVQPLYDAVDPDALETLVADDSCLLLVSFHLEGYRVSVHGDGEIVVDLSESSDGA
jgi:hypothetical protein